MTKRERAARERLNNAVLDYAIRPCDYNYTAYRRALLALLRVVRQEARRPPAPGGAP